MTDNKRDKPDLGTLAGRLTEARLRAGVVEGYTVSRAKMAELVGRIVGKDLDEKQWRRWENGEGEPKLEIIAAAARVSELPPEYIAFGVRPQSLIDPSRDRKLTEEEIARAERQVAAEDAAAAKASARKAGNRGGRK